MQLAIQVVGYLVGLPLEILIIAALLRGGYRQYPFVFLYMLADFATTVVEIRPSLAYGSRSPGAVADWLAVYWVDERVMQGLMFLVVISLIYRAMRDVGPRRTVMLAAVAGTGVVALISFLAHYRASRYVGQWMTPLTRDLNFAAAILDFALWARLISQPRKDYRLLTLCGALGVQFTGQAIGHAVRSTFRSYAVRYPAGVLLMLMNLVFLYLWWQAFRVPRRHTAGMALKETREEAARGD